MRILFTGGGTIGSVSPLIALAEHLRCVQSEKKEDKQKLRFLWIGTYGGPEWGIVSAADIAGVRISTGKLRRYLSLYNITDSFLLFIGFLQSLYHILRFRPTVIVNAGSYVGVPVLWAGWMWGVPSVLLQLDIHPSLSNVVTAFAAHAIAASCSGAAEKLPHAKTVVTGIPVRIAIRRAYEICRQKEKQISVRAFLGIHDDRPYVLVVGGSTGAQHLNELASNLDKLDSRPYHIVLISGNRGGLAKGEQSESFHQFPFLQEEFADVLVCAEVVVCRAGMGTISELAYLKKAAIVVPIPNSHQQENAAYFEREGGIIHLGQEQTNAETVDRIIHGLIRDPSSCKRLGNTLAKLFYPDAAARIAKLL
ncbi:UDP-N-acetylglucosamine--N-acetylmuramyl-(pentapeptide) pyrophosphoryl-undecaprenol N-acetylglucosamine transferase [Candidatus Uhrbacteria bacterium]|nr:UDP-N-acetylglucosamine--N-acetylmuramyl-(pentapeptide) pyrophosphoryl-undecaprenol N-acetylglucosamine transferase [Candidatus Uhrbacteria bacterium]